MTEHFRSPATGFTGYPAAPGRDRGWRRSFRPDRIELLNRYWHDPHGSPDRRSCPACNSGVRVDDYVVHHRGHLYHADCAPDRLMRL